MLTVLMRVSICLRSSGLRFLCVTRCAFSQVPETTKEVSDHLNEAARTVGERAVPAADDVSANIMGHAKNFEKQLPAAADDVSKNLKETAKAAGEQAKIGADEVRECCCLTAHDLNENKRW